MESTMHYCIRVTRWYYGPRATLSWIAPDLSLTRNRDEALLLNTADEARALIRKFDAAPYHADHGEYARPRFEIQEVY
jgi:hypothetical protein